MLDGPCDAPTPVRAPPRPSRPIRPPATAAVARANRALLATTLVTAAAFVATALDPWHRPTWLLESLPVLLIVPVLWATRHRFPLTPLLYGLVAVPLVMLCVGAHYTFERVPVGGWLQSVLDLDRNPYDRIGHVVQGFVPAIALREVLIRESPLARSRWLAPLVICGALAISAAYELVEWGVAVAAEEDAAAFLGMQGDPWDAHWDMACALAGATAALALLGRVHDRAIARLIPSRGP
jgi:putative membrane protein